MSYRLRPATQDDAEFIYLLKKRTLKTYVDAIWGWDEADQISRFKSTFIPDEHQIILVDGQEIGDLSVRIETAENSEELFIAGLFILPEYQGMSIGCAIISDLIKEGARLGRPVRLKVFKGNPARRLYERLGFEPVTSSATHDIRVHTPEQI